MNEISHLSSVWAYDDAEPVALVRDLQDLHPNVSVESYALSED